MNKKFIELLAPAKNIEAAYAAIFAGADAIFIGGPAFGARALAGNSLEDLKTLCDFAHRFNVKIHVTFNTLLYDNELLRAQQLIYDLANCGVDAMIVQDLAVFYMDIPKGIELHASTQCNIDTIEKLHFYAKLGVKQVVVPREFTFEQIKAFHEAEPNVRLEAFIYGALCVSVSGICHISDYLKDRSANRGSCAQICRLPMRLYSNNSKIAEGHLLSLKDNNQTPNLKRMLEAGVSSFKIEGRLKDPDYVKNSVAYFDREFKKILKDNSEYQRQSAGSVSINFVPDLNKTFNRGFTASMFNNDNSNMSNPSTPKYLGSKIGIVQSCEFKGKTTLISVKLFKKAIINNADGLAYLQKDRLEDEIKGFRVNKVTVNNNLARLEVFSRLTLSKGEILYKNYDHEFENSLKKLDSAQRELSYDIKLDVSEDCILKLECIDETDSYGKIEFKLDDAPELLALSKDKTLQILKKRLDKYASVNNIELTGNLDKLKITASKLNELRRELLAKTLLNHRPLVNEQFNRADSLTFPIQHIDERLVLNQKTRKLYQDFGCDFDLTNNRKERLQADSLMTCKFCLAKEYLTCSKDGGKVVGLELEIQNKRYPLAFDCKNCFMHVLKDNHAD